MENNIYKKMVLNMFIGIVLGGITLFGLYTLYEDHVQTGMNTATLNQIVNLINQNKPAPTPTK